MPIENSDYSNSVRLYKLVPATVLQAYQHRIAQTLFGLPKAETKYGQLQVNADGTWRFENLLAKGSNTFNPNNAQTKEKALEFATNWLSQVRSKISEAIEKQIFPPDLQNLIPHNYLHLESATPQYKENSQYITHWDIRYDLEYPYYPNLKARGDQQHFTLQVSDRIIGVEAQCRATNGVEGSALITPAPLQDMEAILQAQIQVENTDDNELSAPKALPLLYRTVGNRLLPYWITQLGDLVAATREGEMVAKEVLLMNDKPQSPKNKLDGTGNLIIIISNTYEEPPILAAIENTKTILKKTNKNWDYIFVKTITEALITLEEESYPKIKNLNYRSHSGWEVNLDGHLSGDIGIAMLGRETPNDLALTLGTAWGEYYFNEGFGGLNRIDFQEKKKKYNPNNFLALENMWAFEQILKMMDDYGYTIFSGCALGQNEQSCKTIAKFGGEKKLYYLFSADHTAMVRQMFLYEKELGYFGLTIETNNEIFDRTMHSSNTQQPTFYKYGFYLLDMEGNFKVVTDNEGYGYSIRLNSNNHKPWEYAYPDDLADDSRYNARKFNFKKIKPQTL